MWCSGYHICFTRRRSPVRSWAGSQFFLHLIRSSMFNSIKPQSLILYDIQIYQNEGKIKNIVKFYFDPLQTKKNPEAIKWSNERIRWPPEPLYDVNGWTQPQTSSLFHHSRHKTCDKNIQNIQNNSRGNQVRYQKNQMTP